MNTTSLNSGSTNDSEVIIQGRPVGPNHPPFIIAELSGNHNRSLERALAIVDAVAAAGADALKLQTYTAETMTLNLSEGEFFIEDPKSLWQGESLYQLYEKAHTPWEWHEPIMRRCRELGLICFSSPFDATAVDFLETLQVPAYKIASFEILDLPLIKKAASTGKPLIISTGMATEAEIDDAVTAAKNAGCQQLILLKCTSSYPANPAESHLRTIPYLKGRFGVQVGLSDHTPGIGAAIAAVAVGATVIEKHVTLSRNDGGVDSAFSLEPLELKQLVQEAAIARQALGSVHLGPSDREKASLQFRRTLYVVEDMQAGEVFSAENVRAIRPGLGLSPKYYETILGQKTKTPITRGTALCWELIDDSPAKAQTLIQQGMPHAH
ncbi:MAG: spsE [Vampirovibrio sp.]|jgi:N-acetylneuraminate synthase|nr:spsE [Vampirovibrio sp.]